MSINSNNYKKQQQRNIRIKLKSIQINMIKSSTMQSNKTTQQSIPTTSSYNSIFKQQHQVYNTHYQHNNNNVNRQFKNKNYNNQYTNNFNPRYSKIKSFNRINQSTQQQQQQQITNNSNNISTALAQLLRSELTINLTNDEPRLVIYNNNKTKISKSSNFNNNRHLASHHNQSLNNFNNPNAHHHKFKYFKFDTALSHSLKNTAPYNTTQYIMYDYSKRHPLKYQQCPNEQQQFSNDWDMAMASSQANFNFNFNFNNDNCNEDKVNDVSCNQSDCVRVARSKSIDIVNSSVVCENKEGSILSCSF